jgi:hypothetical protein
MNASRTPEDDMQPASELEAGQWLAEFACWRAIRPAWLRADGAEPRDVLPDQGTTEYFGTILKRKFEKALHQAFLDKLDPEDAADPQILTRRARVREALTRVPQPESWMDAWPAFWDFFTRPRPKGPPRLTALFKAWPQMEEKAVDEVMSTWEQTGRQESLWAFVQLRALNINVPRTVCSMRARLNLPFKELAADWCAQLGLKSQLEEGVQAHSMEEKRSSSRGEDGLTYGETLDDTRQQDAGAGADLTAQMQQIRRIPEEFVADMTLKERAIVVLRIFGAPLYKPPVSDCRDIDPPCGRDALYQHTFQPVVRRIQEKAAQICRAPVFQQRRQSTGEAEDDKAMTHLVAAKLEEEIRLYLCAWVGHAEGGGKKLSETAPAWLLRLLDSAAPRWKTTMNIEPIIKP